MKPIKISLIMLTLLSLLLATGGLVSGQAAQYSLLDAFSKPSRVARAATFYSSTPEEQGMDSKVLLQILDQIEADQAEVHSILVMRHGALVLEAYYPPFDRQDKHSLFSATKSVLSALIGIAVGEGMIGSLDEPMLNYFQDYTIGNMSAWKQQITINHLLDMNSGLLFCDNMFDQIHDLQFSLDLPAVFEPGTVFEYNSCNSMILSGILQKATGMTALAYAQEKLFGPLQIHDLYWSSTPDGVTQGNVGLMLTPREMLKFGQLYMQNGVWHSQQVVPAEWVWNTEWGNSPDPNVLGYHYQWWQLGGVIGAYGYAGQIVFVFPLADLVVAVTAQLPNGDATNYAGGLAFGAFSAIRSDEALPFDPASIALAERVNAIAHPEAQSVPPPPAMADRIDGEIFSLDENPLGWQTASLSFEGHKAWLSITTTGAIDNQKFAIGLDGLYRQTMQQAVTGFSVPIPIQRNDINPFEFNFLLGVPVQGPVWMKGGWTGEDTFSITVQDSRDYDRDILTFHFSPPEVSIDWFSVQLNATLMTFEGMSY